MGERHRYMEERETDRAQRDTGWWEGDRKTQLWQRGKQVQRLERVIFLSGN